LVLCLKGWPWKQFTFTSMIQVMKWYRMDKENLYMVSLIWRMSIDNRVWALDQKKG
jgi:hypothetical protein